MKIIIFVDGNNKIGMGHIYRSLIFGKELQKNGHKITYMTKEKFSQKIISKTNTCKLYQNLTEPKIKLFLKKLSPDIAILDKLSETKTNLNNIRKFCPIFAIDYTGNNKNLINFGINILYPDSGLELNSYSDINYAILDKKFKKVEKIKISKHVNSILILQGGADTHCFIPKILKSVSNLEKHIQINVVLGPSFQCWEKLDTIIRQMKNPPKIHHAIKNISLLMKKSDLAITAAGNTLLELAHLGVPSLIICAEKFELETANLLERKGFGKNLGFGKNIKSDKIFSELINIMNNYQLRKNMNIIGPNLVDGNGASRIIQILDHEIKKLY